MEIWYFLRARRGELEPLTGDQMEAFLRAERPLPAGDDGFVHYVGLEVALERGVVLALGRVWFGRCELRKDGLLDQRAMLDRANARVAAGRRLESWAPGSEVVVDARDAFETRRLHHTTRWEPDKEDLERLRSVVNDRAGWNIL